MRRPAASPEAFAVKGLIERLLPPRSSRLALETNAAVCGCDRLVTHFQVAAPVICDSKLTRPQRRLMVVLDLNRFSATWIVQAL